MVIQALSAKNPAWMPDMSEAEGRVRRHHKDFIIMQITTGRLKGRRIKLPGSINFRPVQGKVRKALFDILQFKLQPEHLFLDLFGGSGSIGLEAWSRGVENIWINEFDRQNFSALTKTVTGFGLEEKIKLFNLDFRQMLAQVKQDSRAFDFVYAAPPYKETGYYSEVVEFFSKEHGCLTDQGLLILEYFKEPVPIPSGLAIEKEKKYGSTGLLFLRKRRG
jgi:16S rRNA (guanine966-N2)-methyltransferase